MEYTELISGDTDYPALLQQIPQPPAQLFKVGGALRPFMQRPRVAIVGSRRVTAYGRHVTSQLARELASRGVVIISGLALGVDAIAHQGALEAGGDTIAVLPTSLDKLYPANNERLGRLIVAEGGVLLSEYPKGAPFMFKYNFVARNRLISGLADAVLITEAAEDSGSLHTADFALQQGREVLVVPGNITSPTSAGTNNLLKVGATPVTTVNDILHVLKLEPSAAKVKCKGGTPAEQMVLDLIADDIHDGDQLLAVSQLPAAEFNQALTMLEITGKVPAAGANTWY
ncbi:DNA-protecting protein DprA [Polaromonas sp.]|nr:DNA-protecting protein DprA [Candidatus Saccharibacteria bacterium]